jgi:hypothetical protein
MLVLVFVDFRCEQQCFLLVIGSWNTIVIKRTRCFNDELIQAHISFTVHARRLAKRDPLSLISLIQGSDLTRIAGTVHDRFREILRTEYIEIQTEETSSPWNHSHNALPCRQIF